MKKAMFLMLLAMMIIQGCERDQSFKEDIKDVGQDIKNEWNKATD